jgi:hypothetical protein
MEENKTPGRRTGRTGSERPAAIPEKRPAAKAARPKKTVTTSVAGFVTQEERSRMVATAAYFRAEQRGFASGDEVADWLAAEAEVDAILLAAPQGQPVPKPRKSKKD